MKSECEFEGSERMQLLRVVELALEGSETARTRGLPIISRVAKRGGMNIHDASELEEVLDASENEIAAQSGLVDLSRVA